MNYFQFKQYLGCEEGFHSSVSIARFMYYVNLFASLANFLMRWELCSGSNSTACNIKAVVITSGCGTHCLVNKISVPKCLLFYNLFQ